MLNTENEDHVRTHGEEHTMRPLAANAKVKLAYINRKNIALGGSWTPLAP